MLMLLNLLPLGDIDECDDHAVYLAIYCLIRAQTKVEPTASMTADFATDRHEVRKYRVRVLDQVGVFKLGPKLGNRPALIRRRDAEQLRHTIGKAPNAQV